MNPAALCTLLLAWRPLLDPIPLGTSWLVLIVPLVLAVSIAYKAIKLRDLRDLPRQAVMLTAQIVLFMLAAAAVIWAGLGLV